MVKVYAGFAGPGKSPLKAPEKGRLIPSSGPCPPVPLSWCLLVPSSAVCCFQMCLLEIFVHCIISCTSEGCNISSPNSCDKPSKPHIFRAYCLSLISFFILPYESLSCPHQLVSSHTTYAYSYSFPEMFCSVSLNILYH